MVCLVSRYSRREGNASDLSLRCPAWLAVREDTNQLTAASDTTTVM